MVALVHGSGWKWEVLVHDGIVEGVPGRGHGRRAGVRALGSGKADMALAFEIGSLGTRGLGIGNIGLALGGSLGTRRLGQTGMVFGVGAMSL